MDEEPDTITWEREVPLGKDREEALRSLTGEVIEYAMNTWGLAPFDLTRASDSNVVSVTATRVEPPS